MELSRDSKTRRGAGPAILVVLALLLGLPSSAHPVGSVSTISPRPMAMGGAFMAVEDDVAAMAWNPAGLLPPLCRPGGNFRFHVNVLGAPAVARETGLLTGVETDQYGNLPGAEKLTITVGSLVKSVTFRRGGFACGVLLLEEYLDPVGLAESKGLADASDLLDAYYSCLTVAFRPDPRVSIGVTETIFAGLDDSGARRFGIGGSYGAILKPNEKVTVGLTYFYLPADFAEYRRGVEGLAPQTMNAGLSYRPTQSVLLTFDLRDLAEKRRDTALVPHAGLEWNLWGKGALRVGTHGEEGAAASVLTLGVGVIPMLGCWEGWKVLRSDTFALNYAALLSEGKGPSHLLSVILHF